MNKRVAELLKQFKDDLEENKFNRIIYDCPPMFMQELLDVFHAAEIVVPPSEARQYADVFCYLASHFNKISLCHVKWTSYDSIFVFDVSGVLNVKFDELRAHLYRLTTELIKIDQDWNGYCTLTVRIFNQETICYENIVL